MHSGTLALIALAVLGYGLVSRRAERTFLTAPLAFVLLGFALGVAFLDPGEAVLDAAILKLVAEITLMLILFADASRIDLRVLFRERGLPLRLLLIGLPLTIALGTGIAKLIFPGLGIFAAAVLAAMLAPTDAALGQAVVGNKQVPLRIRQSLNVESGLNDGMVLPALLVFMSACAAEHGGSAGYWARFALLQVTLGPMTGAAIGYVGGRLVERASTSGWMNETFEELSAVSLSVLAYATAEHIGGNGFIAAFIAGMALGNFAPRIARTVHAFGETEGQLLSVLVFLAFGALLLPPAVHAATPAAWLYAGLSLTVIRMLPVALCLIGTRLRPRTVLFVGWFGPRGLASVLFALLVLEDRMVPNGEAITHVAYLTVLLSVMAHGVTAYPLSERFGRSLEDAHPSMPEALPVTEMPPRIRMG